MSEAFLATAGSEVGPPSTAHAARPTQHVRRARRRSSRSSARCSRATTCAWSPSPVRAASARHGSRCASPRELGAVFEDGAAFVPLAAVRDPDARTGAIAAAVGLRDSARRATLEALKRDLADRSLLLVLDNFEHLLAADVLLPTCSAPRPA